MHELPVTQGILAVVLDAAQQAGARRIRSIDLVIGELSSIVDDSVQFYFDILSRDTPAEGATLNFQRQAVKVICGECGSETASGLPLPTACPACGGMRLQVNGGREFYVESIQVDDEDSGGTGNSQRQRSGGS